MCFASSLRYLISHGAIIMLKIITSIFGSLIFFVLPSGTLAQAQNDFLQPESGVELGNEFSEI